MNTTDEVEIPFVLIADVYDRDEWGNKKLLYPKGGRVYGTEDGEFIVTGTKKRQVYVPKSITKRPNLKCEGWNYGCDRNDAWTGHMNTRYEHEESNIATLCPECWKECHEHWNDMWTDYYSNCM